MSLAKKYGIPENIVRQLYDDGWLVSKANPHEYIYKYYIEARNSGLSNTDAVSVAAEKGRVCERLVYKVINEFE